MAKVFLDTNYLMDIFMRKTRKLADTGSNDLYASPLSFHIISYVHKLSIPNQQLINILQDIATISLSNNILNKALHYAVERKRVESELVNAYRKVKEAQAQLVQSEKMTD